MINKTTLNAIHPLLSVLDTTKHLLVPLEASPVVALNDAAYTPLIDMYDDEAGFEDKWLASLQRSPVLGAVGVNEVSSDGDTQTTIAVSMHSRSMEEAAEVVSQATRNAMNNARNIVLPIASDVIADVDNHLVDIAEVRELYEIIDVELPVIWKNPVVEVALEQHTATIKSVARADIPKIVCPDNIAVHLVTGSGEFDKAFNAAVATLFGKGHIDEGIKTLFNELFNSNDKVSGVEYPFWRTRNRTLIKYLMVSILLDRPIENSGIGLLQWETVMSQLLNVLGDGCKFIAETDAADIDANLLHIETDVVNNRIYLNSAVYSKWLDEGGSSEVILGAVFNSQDKPTEPISYSGTLENATKYRSIWESYHSNNVILNDARRLEGAKNGLYIALTKAIDNLEATQMPDLATRQALHGRAKSIVADVNAHDITDMGRMCLIATCRAMFYHTPAEHLLLRIEDRVAENMPVDEAATAVMIEYITDWIASGIGIEKI